MKLKDVLESITREPVIRKGKRFIKFSSNKEGYKIVNDNGHRTEVKMPYAEIRKRAISGKKAARKRKGKQSRINAMRKRSTKLHTW